MEKICQHIEKLLAQHDYVVVPGLGGFVVQMQSAQLLPGRITPPTATIAFNPLMQHSDGLLAIELARTEQISYRKATECIEIEVESFKQKLQSNQIIILENLGSFNQDETGNLIFSPLPKADFLPHNFLLSDLMISTKELRDAGNKKKITITMPSAIIFRYAAAAMILFGLFAITPKLSDSRQANNASIINIPVAVKPKVEKPATIDTVKVIKDTIEITESKSTPTNIVNEIPTETPVFHVIVASSSTKEAAERYCKKLAADNFKGAQVLPPIKTYRVAIKSFSDKEEAIKYMENLRQTDSRFETAWVLCNQPNS